MTEIAISDSSEGMRVKYGLDRYLRFTCGSMILAAILRWRTAQEVTTDVGAVTGIMGTLVGTFFGIHVGAKGK